MLSLSLSLFHFVCVVLIRFILFIIVINTQPSPTRITPYVTCIHLVVTVIHSNYKCNQSGSHASAPSVFIYRFNAPISCPWLFAITCQDFFIFNFFDNEHKQRRCEQQRELRVISTPEQWTINDMVCSYGVRTMRENDLCQSTTAFARTMQTHTHSYHHHHHYPIFL